MDAHYLRRVVALKMRGLATLRADMEGIVRVFGRAGAAPCKRWVLPCARASARSVPVRCLLCACPLPTLH